VGGGVGGSFVPEGGRYKERRGGKKIARADSCAVFLELAGVPVWGGGNKERRGVLVHGQACVEGAVEGK